MAAFDYARPLATANRLIARFGQTGAVRRDGEDTGPAYDPTPGEPVDHPAQFAIVDFSAREIDGTRVLMGDKKALLAPGSLTIVPGLSDRLVEAGGAVWDIVGVETLRPAETTLLYTLVIRQ
jgi:hypothetical protein